MRVSPGDVVNEFGDLYLGAFSGPLAAGRTRVNCRQAGQAANYGWRWKTAEVDEETGVLVIWIERHGPIWKTRRR